MSVLTTVSQPSNGAGVDEQSVYQALADPTRRRILHLLRDGELAAGELAQAFEKSWPTVSRHLGVLKSAGLVRSRRDRKRVLYALNTEVLRTMTDDLQRLGETPDDAVPVRGQRLSEQVRAVMTRAQRAAIAMGHARCGTHHLLVAVAETADSAGGRALSHLQVQPGEVRATVARLFPPEQPADSRAAGQVPFEWEAKDLISGATVGEAMRLRRDVVGTAELLVALVRERVPSEPPGKAPRSAGKAAQVLSALGVDSAQLEAAVADERIDEPHERVDNGDLDHLVGLIAANHELTWTLFVGIERQLRTIQAQLAAMGNN